jgi:replicative DNA helicase
MHNLKDLAAERAVLSALCQYGLDALLECSFLDVDHFSENNKLHYNCIKSCLDKGGNVDLTLILSSAKELGCESIISTNDEVSFIRSLFTLPIQTENVSQYYAKLVKLKIARDLEKTLRKCTNEIANISGEESIADLLSIIERPFLEITSSVHNTDNRVELISANIDEHIQYLIDNPNTMPGLSSGFPQWDEAIGGGLRRGGVNLIAARTGCGKSMFSNCAGIHNAKNGIPVLYLDTEMDDESQKDRLLANLSNIPTKEISSGNFGNNPLSIKKVKEAANTLKSIPYHYINISGQDFENILSVARKWIYQHVGFNDDGTTKDCLIIYDYLKLMSSDSMSNGMQEYQVLGFQITQLHNFCVKYDVPCLSFVQTNREGITKESSDIVSGSDRLAWLCTSLTVFKVKSDEEQAEDRSNGLERPFNRKLVPIKARYGGGLEDGNYINIMMEGEYGRLTEGPTRNNTKKWIENKNKEFDKIDDTKPITTQESFRNS